MEIQCSFCSISVCTGNWGIDSLMLLSPNTNPYKYTNRSHHHLRQISKIRKYLTKSATQSLVQALVASRLDYCNALYQGLPKSRTSTLQRIQNTSARLITGTPRRHHITPVLKSLHWLPIPRRLELKTLSYVYKAFHEQAQHTFETCWNGTIPCAH